MINFSKLKKIIFYFSLFLSLGTCLFCLQEENQISEEVKIIAAHSERVEKRIVASGNVEVIYKNIKLLADRIELDTESKDVFASGNVVLQTPDEVISAEEIRFNLHSSEGELRKVFGMIQPTIFYEADNIERKEQDLYRFEKARITSCTQPVPRWDFSCSRADFKKDKYIEMWGMLLRIKGIPVFYFPYLKYPLDKERSTGFLMPQIGHSGPKGFFISQSFYWALKRNMDATLNVDFYSARGIGGGLEYRYLFSEGTGGELNLYYFDFRKNVESNEPQSAYIIRLNHNHPLPYNFNLVAKVDYQSSYDFLREFDNNFKRAVISNRNSQVYLSRSWSSFNLNLRVSRFETYFSQRDGSIIKNNFPEASFSSSKIKLFSPLFFSFTSNFTRWEYGWDTDYEAGSQKKSQSLTFNPCLSFPLTSIPWLTINSSLSARFAYYFQSYAPGTKTVVDEHLFTNNYVFDVEFIGPVFYKIFYDSLNEPKLKHIIEPTFSYKYESPLESSQRIITAGYLSRNHYLRYGLTNRIIIKEDNMPREIFTLGFSQNFYLLPEEGPLSRYRVDGKIPEFSDLSAYLRFYPLKNYSLDFTANFNPYYRTFSSLRLGANLGSPLDNTFLRVNWYKSINPYQKMSVWNRHQVGLYAGLKIPQLSTETQAEIDFNIQERKMLYSAFMFIYHYQCLDFRVDLKIFYFRERPETQFRVSIGLGNIGKTTDFLGGIGF